MQAIYRPESKQKKCIKLDIGKCIGPCIYKETKDEYDQLIQQCIQFWKGKARLIENLKLDMKQLSDAQDYERAAKLRDRIQQLEQIQAQQQIELDTNQHHFFIGFSSNQHFHYGVCQHYAHKRFISQTGKYTPIENNLETFIMHFIDSILNKAPKKITLILSSDIAVDIDAINTTYPINITVQQPTKGRYFELLCLAELNAQKSLIGISKTSLVNQLESPLDLLKRIYRFQNDRILFLVVTSLIIMAPTL